MEKILNIDLEEIDQLEKEYNDSIDVVIKIPNKGYFECVHDAYSDNEVNIYLISKEIKKLEEQERLAILRGEYKESIEYGREVHNLYVKKRRLEKIK